jgi:hypothetical protein
MKNYTEMIKSHGCKPITAATISEIKKQAAEMKIKMESITPVNETHAKCKENGLIAVAKFETNDPEFWAKIQYTKDVEKFGININVLVQEIMSEL